MRTLIIALALSVSGFAAHAADCTVRPVGAIVPDQGWILAASVDGGAPVIVDSATHARELGCALDLDAPMTFRNFGQTADAASKNGVTGLVYRRLEDTAA